MTPEIIYAAQEYIERITAAGIDALRIDYSAESAEICMKCDGEIPKRRRDAFPGVQTCIDCQQEVELRERIRRGI